jgi:hypothetical protein
MSERGEETITMISVVAVYAAFCVAALLWMGRNELMETDAARTGKDEGRATRDAGSGRSQYPARNRDQASP